MILFSLYYPGSYQDSTPYRYCIEHFSSTSVAYFISLDTATPHNVGYVAIRAKILYLLLLAMTGITTFFIVYSSHDPRIITD